MSQITIGGTTLNFKDSAFTGDQWEQVASWVLNGGAEGIDANAQIATEKAAAASASAASARNSATSAGESATAAKSSEVGAAGSAEIAAGHSTRAGKSAAVARESAANAENSASVASSKSNDAISAASDAQDAKNKAANSQAAAKKSEDNAAANATNAGKSASSAANSAASASSSATAAANSAASAAESIKHAPRINANGKWELWDATTNAYVATEYTAIGEDGVRGRGWYQHTVAPSNPQSVAWTGLFAAPKWGEGDWLYNPDNGNVGICTSRTDNADGSGHANITYKGTLKGADGTTPHIGANGNWYIGDTDTGVSAGGIDLPTVTDADAGKYLHVNSSTKKLEWAEVKSVGGSGSGDMTKAVYDPKGKAQDIFAYADAKQAKITASGILKGNGAGVVSAAVKGTDYAAPSVGVSVTLRASGWNANTKIQTVSVSGVTDTVNLIITAATNSYMAYAKAGVRCTAQGAGTLTFACETVPTADVSANVLIVG